MGLQNDTSTDVVVVDENNSVGTQFGNSTTDKISFYGKTPVVQQTGYSALTDSSGGTAAAGTGIQALTSSYNSALIVNGISTLAAAINGIRSALVAVGVIK